MTSKFTELAIDCADPSVLARFWCHDGIVMIRPTLTFARVPVGNAQ
jgi:hypothetical protein